MAVSQTFLYIVIGIWCLTLLRSILIMLGKKVFKDASLNENNALFPLINLFSFLEIVDLSTYLGILLFIPGFNLIILVLMSYKLGKAYNCETSFILGLVCLPIVFYPSLFNSTRKYKYRKVDTFESMKGESINLLTEEEIKAQNDSPYELDPAVDSIFKSKLDTMEEVPTYKAKKLDKDIVDELRDLGEEENPFAPIKRIEHVYSEEEHKKEISSNAQVETVSNSKFVGELDKTETKKEVVDETIEMFNELKKETTKESTEEKTTSNKFTGELNKKEDVEFIDL